MTAPGIDDVLSSAAALDPLAAAPGDWSAVAAPTTWSATRCLDHIVDALLFYTGQVARRADHVLPVLRNGDPAPATPADQVDRIHTAAATFAVHLRDLGEQRAWHPSGMADVPGWAGMAVTELLVHGTDAARAVGVDLVLPDTPCRRTVRRVFPWIDHESAAPGELLLAVTGRAEVPGIADDPSWWWQSAPLSEWNGEPRRRTHRPRWS